MVEQVYDFFNSLGYTHPLHPPLTHIPVGMAMGAFLFRMAALFSPMKQLGKTSYHCIVLGLIGIPPTVAAGLLDWQRRFDGEWEALIVFKMILAVVLTSLLAVTVRLDKPETPGFGRNSLFYVLILLTAAALGYCGGELQFG